MADITLALSGILVALRGLSEPLEQSFRGPRWRRFVTTDPGESWLDVTVREGGDAVAGGTLSMEELAAEFNGEAARFSIAEGDIELTSAGAGSARARLAPAPVDTQHYVLINLICAALATTLPSRGAALLHAAGCLLEDHAFLLVGPAGSGKSTWIEHARRGGATVLSDDIIFVDTSGGRIEALSTPIRGEKPIPCEPGRWPVGALLFPVHGETPSVAPVSRLMATGRVTANLPFVAERQAEERFHDVIERLVSGVPVYDLTFAEDPSFLDCLATLIED